MIQTMRQLTDTAGTTWQWVTSPTLDGATVLFSGRSPYTGRWERVLASSYDGEAAALAAVDRHVRRMLEHDVDKYGADGVADTVAVAAREMGIL